MFIGNGSHAAQAPEERHGTRATILRHPHGAPTELVGVRWPRGYKHGAPDGACAAARRGKAP